MISVSIVPTLTRGPHVLFKAKHGVTIDVVPEVEKIIAEYGLSPRYRVRVKNGFLQVGKAYKSGSVSNWYTVNGEKMLPVLGRDVRTMNHLRLTCGLSAEQWKIFELMEEGLSNDRICEEIGMHKDALRHHVHVIYRSVEVKSEASRS